MTVPVALAELQRQLTDFVAALQGESDALGSARIADLESVLARKNELAAGVSTAWTQAMHWLRSQSSHGLNRGLDIPVEILPHWQAIVALAQQAETLNQRNGQLIEAQLQRTKGAIEVLQSAARPAHLYGADGHMLHLPGQGHTLDKV